MCIDPQIPDNWKGFSVERQCRGYVYKIQVRRGGEDESGLYVNGVKREGNLVPWDVSAEKEIEVVLIL